MKRFLSGMLALTMMLCFVWCGTAQQVKADEQEYTLIKWYLQKAIDNIDNQEHVKKVANQLYEEAVAGQEEERSVNEIKFIQQALRSYSDKLEDYTRQLGQASEAVRGYNLRKLLKYSADLSENEITRIFSTLSLELNSDFVVVVLRIDQIEKEDGDSDVFIRHALHDIALKTIRQSYAAESDMYLESNVELIVAVDEDKYLEQLELCYQRIQGHMRELFHAVISMSISPMAKSADMISEMREVALRQLHYTFQLGYGKFLHEEIVRSYQQSGVTALSRSMLQSLSLCKSEQLALQVLEKLFDEIRGMDYEAGVLATIRLMDVLNNQFSWDMPISAINTQLAEGGSLDDVIAQVTARLDQTFQQEAGAQEKALMDDMIRRVRDYAEANYMDPGFCLEEISKYTGIPQRRLSAIIRKEMGMTFAEYLILLRVEKAKEYLCETRLDVKEISKKVGIENDTYFYKRFKEKCGLTPMEYRRQVQKI